MNLTSAIGEVVYYIDLVTKEELEELKDIIDIELNKRNNYKLGVK